MTAEISLGARLRQLAQAAPERPIVTDQQSSRTRDELDRHSNRIAHALRTLGVKHGDLVSIGLPNSVGFIEACYAVWKLGATPQPLSFRLPKAEANAIAALARSPLLIADATLDCDLPRFDIAQLLAMSLDEAPLEDQVAPHFKAPTSGGSTGRPKLILSGAAGVFDTGRPGAFGITHADVVVVPAPLYHNAPFIAAMSAINQGGCLVLLPRFDAEETLKAIERHRGSWIYLVPTMMSRIWKLPLEVRDRYDLSTLRAAWHMAAPCPAWLKRAWIEWLGPDVIMELYAGTEAQAATIISGREWLAHPGSVGRPAHGEMKVVDSNGDQAPCGEVGEIYMRRDAAAPASYQYVGATAKDLPGGWETIGDLGSLDADGYLYLADRRTDMILVGGANVYPAEVEAALDSHPLVESSAVIGLPDDEMGSIVHAIVQAHSPLTVSALHEHLRERLAPYKLPKSYEFITTAIRDDGGKVRRSQLRQARINAPSVGHLPQAR
jgi:bile acid-coenzyme A ligase